MILNRRRFLSTAILAGAGATAAGRALALTVREATPGENEAYVAVCRSRQSDHDDLVREILALMEEQELPVDRQREVLKGLTCPLCGCALALS